MRDISITKINLKQTDLLVMNVSYVGVASAVRASGLVNGDVVIKGNVGHTHAPIPGRREALQARNSIRHQAAATQDTPQQIIANCVQNLPEGSVFSSSFKVGKI